MDPLRDNGPASPLRGGPAADGPDAAAPAGSAGGEPLRSLQDDVAALLSDGRTYFDAELAFQKSRALYVAEEGKSALVLGIAGALLALLTLIGLTVGLIIALAQHIGPWAAAAVVVVALAIGTFVLLRAAQRRWVNLMAAFQDEPGERP